MIHPLRLAPLALLLLTAACAAGPAPGTPAAQVQATVDDTPAWYTNPPTEANSISAAGTAVSTDMQLAMDKAVLSAKRTLADTLNGLLSSKMKEFVSESGTGEDAQVLRESERVTSNLITETNLGGYQRTQSKIIPQGAQYRAYALLQYPTGSANKVLVDRVKQNQVLEGRLRGSKAFQDLEKEIEDARNRKE